MLAGVVILFFSLTSFTIRLSPQSPLGELQTARGLWKKQNVTDYSMTVVFGGAFICCNSLNFTIKNSEVASIETIEYGSTTGNFISPLEKPNWFTNGYKKFFPPNLADYTVDQIFDFADQKLRDEQTPPMFDWCGSFDISRQRYMAKFDKEKGYPTSLGYGSCVPRYDWGLGLICPVVTDCGIGIYVRD